MIFKRFNWVTPIALVLGLALSIGLTTAQDEDQATYYPGQMMTIEDSMITAGSTRQVTFTGAGDYAVTVEATHTEEDKLYVAVPPYVDRANLTVVSGELTVTLDLAPWYSQTITVTAPPTPEGIEPVDLLVIMLEQAVTNMQASITAFQTASSADLLQPAVDGMNAQVVRLQDQINQIRTNGAIILTDVNGDEYQITAEDLALSAKLLYGAMEGLTRAMTRPEEEVKSTATEEDWRNWTNGWSVPLARDFAYGGPYLIDSIKTNAAIAEKMPEWFDGDDPARFTAFSKLTVPMITWANKELSDVGGLAVFAVQHKVTAGDIPAETLAEIRTRIDVLERVVAASRILWGFENQKPYDVYVGLNAWVKTMNTILEALNDWHEAMSSGGGGGGGDDDGGGGNVDCGGLTACGPGSMDCYEYYTDDYTEVSVGYNFSGTLNSSAQAYLVIAPSQPGCLELDASGTDMQLLRLWRTYKSFNSCYKTECDSYIETGGVGRRFKLEAGTYLLLVKADAATARNTAFTLTTQFSPD